MEENRNTPEVTTKPSKSFAEITNIVLDWIKKNKVATIAIAVALVMTVGFILALAIPRNNGPQDPDKTELIPIVHGEIPELNLDKLVANLESAGYEIEYSDEDEMLLGQTHNIYAENEETDDHITVVIYENAEYALASYYDEMGAAIYLMLFEEYYVEMLEKELEIYGSEYTPEKIAALENSIQILKNTIANYESSMSHGCIDGVIWVGTTKAVEDTRTK